MIKIKTALFSLVAAVGLSSAALTLAQAQQKPAAKPPEAARPAEPAKEGAKQQPAAQQPAGKQPQRPAQVPINPVAQAAAGAGAVDCMGQINRVSNFLTANARSGAHLFLSPTEGARRLTSVSFEVSAQNVLAYASASFSPGGTGACQALYESVVYWEKSCADVAKAAFGTLKPDRPVLKDIEVLADQSTLRVFLMPAGKGCVSIKKDVLF